MAISQTLPIVIQAATPAALRAQASAGLTGLSISTCLEGAELAVYGWNAASIAADTGAVPGVRKPNDILAANPGRWIVRDWPDQSAIGVYGTFLLPFVLPATGPAALLLSIGWEVVSITDVGGVRTAWLRRLVHVA